MIELGETTDSKREVVFHLSKSSDNSNLTGHSWSSGELQIAGPAGTYANADQTRIVERGNGDYAYPLTNTQANIAGVYSFYCNVALVSPFNFVDEVRDFATMAGVSSAQTAINGHTDSQLTSSVTAVNGHTDTATSGVAGVATAVWDVVRSGHMTSGSFGEGINVVSIATVAANTVRDSLLNFAHRSGRTFKGFIRRVDAFVAGVATGTKATSPTFYQPDGTTVEYSITSDPTTANRTTPVVTNSEA